MKTIILILALASNVGAFDVIGGPLSGGFPSTYVLRDPLYDGVQAVTVSSLTAVGQGATNTGILVGSPGATNIGAKIWYLNDDGAGNSNTSLYIDNLWNSNNSLIRFRLQTAGTPVEMLTLKPASGVLVPGSSFSVGGSTLAVAGGNIGAGMTPDLTAGWAFQTAANKMFVADSQVMPLFVKGGTGSQIVVNRSPLTGTFFDTGKAAASIAINSEDGNGYLTFNTASANNTNPSARMTILGGGNVGIGTASPSSKLDIEGKSWTDGYASGVYAVSEMPTAMSSGTVVSYSFYGADLKITTAAASGAVPVGTIYDDSCAAGAACRVCTSGLCYARLVSDEGCARATDQYVINGDEAGRAQCVTAPDAPTHNREIGQPASWNASNASVIYIWAHKN